MWKARRRGFSRNHIHDHSGMRFAFGFRGACFECVEAVVPNKRWQSNEPDHTTSCKMPAKNSHLFRGTLYKHHQHSLFQCKNLTMSNIKCVFNHFGHQYNKCLPNHHHHHHRHHSKSATFGWGSPAYRRTIIFTAVKISTQSSGTRALSYTA